MVFAIGLKATFEDASYLFRNPGLLAREFVSMNVLMPVFAVILVLRFHLDPAVKVALIALSVSPVPPFFPKNAMKAGGTQRYTIGVLAAAAMVAIIVVPVTMAIFGKIGKIPLQMPAGAVVWLLARTILGPLLIGIYIRSRWPSFADRVSGKMGTLAMVCLGVGVLPILLLSIRPMLSLVGNGTLLSLAIFAIAGLAFGYLLGGPRIENRHVLALATASRHPGMALAIAHANFPGQKLAAPAIALYLIVATILSALFDRWLAKRAKGASPEYRRAA